MANYRLLSGILPMAAAFGALGAPATATTSITDPISDPAGKWAGIDYWGVQVSQFSTVDQSLTFTVPFDSKIDIFMGGSPKFRFSDLLLNGQSIASGFTINGTNSLMATGFTVAGDVTLRFLADYNCSNCWGDWFGGYVQVSAATLSPPPKSPPLLQPIPEPASWAMMIAGFGAVGAMLRYRHRKIRLV